MVILPEPPQHEGGHPEEPDPHGRGQTLTHVTNATRRARETGPLKRVSPPRSFLRTQAQGWPDPILPGSG